MKQLIFIILAALMLIGCRAKQTVIKENTTASLIDTTHTVADTMGAVSNYTDTTTTGDSRIDENKRKASIPIRFDAWSGCKFPLDGDIIRCRIGNHTEEGIVKDCEGDNDRTVVYWSLKRV